VYHLYHATFKCFNSKYPNQFFSVIVFLGSNIFDKARTETSKSPGFRVITVSSRSHGIRVILNTPDLYYDWVRLGRPGPHYMLTL